MGSLLVIALALQFRARRYVPALYWLAVVLLSIVGTLITDNLVDNYGVALQTTTIVFSIALALTFAVWWASGRAGDGVEPDRSSATLAATVTIWSVS